MSIQAFLCFEVAGAAGLALWTVARFPRLGPKSLKPAIAICVAALALVQALPVAIVEVVRLPHGAYLAIFGCVLPGLVLAFLAAAWLIRSLAGALGGSGGGPGTRVPAASR